MEAFFNCKYLEKVIYNIRVLWNLQSKTNIDCCKKFVAVSFLYIYNDKGDKLFKIMPLFAQLEAGQIE